MVEVFANFVSSTFHSSLVKKFERAQFLDSLVVEVPGIEPGSFRVKIGLLRA